MVKNKDFTMLDAKDLPIGGVLPEAGSAHEYETGGWRKLRPVFDPEKCIDCLTCWVMCPDSAIYVEDDKIAGYDLDHCKGCGICAVECPDKVQAITMVEEEN